MTQQTRWIELDGAVNVRDLGGLPTADGAFTQAGHVLRGDNLQQLSPSDMRWLLDDLGLRHVIDLRSEAEVRLEGPGPLTRVPRVSLHHFSLFAEGGKHTDVVDGQAVLPWQGLREAETGADRSIGYYLRYLGDRPDSIVAALRVMAHEEGASLVHCAAGKDRTGVAVAFALEVAGVTREAIVDDYVQTGERLEHILARLRASPTYAEDVDSRPAESHRPRASTMEKFLAAVDERHGGPLGWLGQHGWTPADERALRARLLG